MSLFCMASAFIMDTASDFSFPAEQMVTGSLQASGGVSMRPLSIFQDETYKTYVEVIFQQPRPGPPLPKGEHYLTVGWKQVNSRV